MTVFERSLCQIEFLGEGNSFTKQTVENCDLQDSEGSGRLRRYRWLSRLKRFPELVEGDFQQPICGLL